MKNKKRKKREKSKNGRYGFEKKINIVHYFLSLWIFFLIYSILGVIVSIFYWKWICNNDNDPFLFLSTWLLIETIFGIIFIFIVPVIYNIITRLKKKCCARINDIYFYIYLILYCLFIYGWVIIGFTLLFKYYYECLNEFICIVCFIYIFSSLFVPCILHCIVKFIYKE